jgi:2-iminobutanoate/2-iminopropanoate deaminase
MRQAIKTPNAPASPLFSQAVKAGDYIYVSGLVGVDVSTGKLAGQTINEQTRQALMNCQAVLLAAGATLEDVVEVGVLLTNPGDFAGMNHEYGTWFQDARQLAMWRSSASMCPVELTTAVTSPRGACLELAAVEATDLYFERLANLTTTLGFSGVMEQMESLTDESFVEYVASRYVTTLAGRSVLDKERLRGGDDQGSNSRVAHSWQ